MSSRNIARIIAPVAAAVALAAVSGCKAPSAPDSGFLQRSEQLQKVEQYPFHRIWVRPGFEASRYASIAIAPVNTSHLRARGIRSLLSFKPGDHDGHVEDLARYTRETFADAFRAADEEQRFEVVETPRDDSLIFELALVEVVPNNAYLGAIGLLATAGAPAGTSVLAKEAAKGRVAIEGRLVDARSGEVVAMFADREHGKFTIISLPRATWYGEARIIIEEWAGQWVQVVNARPGEAIGDTAPFTPVAW